MLKSLFVENFRGLADLKIKSLERINLIIGKNNTGKSTLLEALLLYGTRGNVRTLNFLQEQRGIFEKKYENTPFYSIEVLSYLFTHQDISKTIVVGEIKDDVLASQDGILQMNLEIHEQTSQPFWYIKFDAYDKIIQSFDKWLRENDTRFLPQPLQLKRDALPEIPCQYVTTKSFTENSNSQFWDKIILTPKEEYVVEALKIIEPKIERLAFVEGQRVRQPVVKMRDAAQVVLLKSMGDGINRMLSIILALVSAEGGFLLIDEFENGLHYTVQERLWQMIFMLSEKLDVQVFATTHSEDCIRGFENVLNDYGFEIGGKLIRLDREGDAIFEVEFDKTELKTATDFGIEIR